MSAISINAPAIRIFNSCDKKSAIEKLNKHLSKKPNDAMAIFYRGLSHLILNNLQAANDDLNKAIQVAPNKMKSYFKAKKSFFSGNLSYAETEALIAANDNTSCGEPWSIIGDINFSRNSYQNGITAYNRAIELKAIDSNWNYVNIGLYYESIGEYEKAMNMYNNAINECDCFTKAYICKAYLAKEKFNDNETFITCIQKARTFNQGLTDEFLDNNGYSMTPFESIKPDKAKLFAYQGNSEFQFKIDMRENSTVFLTFKYLNESFKIVSEYIIWFYLRLHLIALNCFLFYTNI